MGFCCWAAYNGIFNVSQILPPTSNPGYKLVILWLYSGYLLVMHIRPTLEALEPV